ncbi:hypothetical protein RM590_06315 [Streptomyces sp. DSM 44938]|uniref:Gram-positive cocci surface proteins LPxTG domain-containing protein n=2 Tax=Streptomyces litchfieldiae TaxID=3075543 RepID=A0ABU2MKX1_9ACTN|nr:hypothetical protein [Streptomyces sp. DSM 44938]
MATAAVIALFVPSAVAGDPPSNRDRVAHLAPGHGGHPRTESGGERGGGAERPTASWASISDGVPAVRPESAERDAPRPAKEPTTFAARPGGEVLPVLPLGAGLASLGTGLGILGLRLRRV